MACEWQGTISIPMKTRPKRSKREPKPEEKSNSTHEHDWVYTYQPRTELGRKLLELRRKYIESGGELLSVEELVEEICSERGRSYDD